MRPRRWLVLALAISVFAVSLTSSASAAEKGLAGKYTDPTYFTKIPFGAHSHWLQPWRAYLETVPAQQFLDGIGLNLQFHEADPELVLQMLARNGVRSGRLEIGWGSLDYNDPAKIQGADQLRRILRLSEVADPAHNPFEQSPGRALPGEDV